MGGRWGGWWDRVGSWRWVTPSVRTVWTSYESQEVLAISPNMFKGPKRHLFHYHWDQFQTHAFHVVAFMGLIFATIVCNAHGFVSCK